MTLGLVGLLWLLQAAVPQQQDTIRQNQTLRILRDSVINYLIQDSTKQDTAGLFFPIDENTMKLLPVMCNNGFYRSPDEKIFSSAGFCRR